MTLAELLARVRLLVRDPNKLVFTDEDLTGWVEDARRAFMAQIPILTAIAAHWGEEAVDGALSNDVDAGGVWPIVPPYEEALVFGAAARCCAADRDEAMASYWLGRQAAVVATARGAWAAADIAAELIAIGAKLHEDKPDEQLEFVDEPADPQPQAGEDKFAGRWEAR